MHPCLQLAKEPGVIAELPNQKEETMKEDVLQLFGPFAA